MNEYMRKRRERRRNQARERLGGRCLICGTTELLEFDHVDPDTKTAEVSSAKMLDGPLEQLFAEVDKCQLLCRSHHIEKAQLNQEFGGGHNRHTHRPHGSGMQYAERCRCSECKLWKRLYRRNLVDYTGQPITSDAVAESG